LAGLGVHHASIMSVDAYDVRPAERLAQEYTAAAPLHVNWFQHKY